MIDWKLVSIILVCAILWIIADAGTLNRLAKVRQDCMIVGGERMYQICERIRP